MSTHRRSRRNAVRVLGLLGTFAPLLASANPGWATAGNYALPSGAAPVSQAMQTWRHPPQGKVAASWWVSSAANGPQAAPLAIQAALAPVAAAAAAPADTVTRLPFAVPAGQAVQVVRDATVQAVRDAVAATREVAGDLWPLTYRRNSVSANALGQPRAGQARSLRINDLPGLLSVAPELPLAEGSGPAGTRALTLEQAMALGVQNSLEVKAAGARLEAFEQTTVAAQGALLPHLDARAAVGQGRLESVSPTEQRLRKDGTVTLRQTLFDLPATREVQRQSVLSDSARLQLQAAVSTASLQVSANYLQALQARLVLELGADQERLLGELLTYVSRRAEAGGTSIAERDRVKARVANARSQQADARANLRAALRNLATLLGEAPAQLVLNVPLALSVPETAAQALDEARVANRDLVASRTEAEAAGLEAKGQRARFLPKVELEVSHARAINASGTDSYSRDTKAMVVINWSLLNGGTDLAQGRAAAARMREKQWQADDLERKLQQDLEATYASLDSVTERYTALREELVANRSVVEAFKAQLVGGNRPLLDVLDAYQRLHQSRIDLAQLVLGEVNNHAKVAHITGRLASAGLRP